MKNRLIDFLLAHRKRLALISFIVLGVVASFIRPAKISGELSGFSANDAKYAEAGLQIAEAFGSRKFIQIKITPTQETAGTLFQSLEKIETQFQRLYPNAISQSLHHSKSILNLNDSSSLPIAKLLEKASQIPMVSQLISADHKSFLFLVWMDSTDVFDEAAYNQVVDATYPGIEKMQSMSPYHIETEIAKSIGRDLVVLSGIIGLFFTFFVLFAYRSFSAVLFIGAIVGISMIPAIACFSIFQVPMNLITVLVIPVVLVLSLSDAIHMLTGFSARDGELSFTNRLRGVYQDYLVPSFYTSLTTAVAFISFIFNESKNIRDFGLITGIAVMLAYFLIYFTAGYLLQHVSVRSVTMHSISKFSDLFVRHRKKFSWGLTIGLIASCFSIPHLRFYTDLDSFIPRNTKLHEDYTAILGDFNSQLRLEVMIESTTVNPDKNDERNLKNFVTQLHSEIEMIPGVGAVNSIKDLEDFKRGFGPAAGFIRFPTKKNPFVTEDKLRYRLDVRVKESKFIQSVEQQIRTIFESKSSGYKLITFSRALLIDETNAQVAKSLLWSLLFSCGLIGLLFFIMTKSVRLSLYALYANIIPLGIMMLVFWIFDLDLNVLTAMTAVVCMGLVVDDTIHVLYRQGTLKKEIGELGFGVLTTSIILFGGFAAFLFSSFLPSQIFGIVSAFTFLVAVVADLTVLPYLLERKQNNASDSTP